MNILIAIAHQLELDPFKAKFQVEETYNNGHGKVFQLVSNNGNVRLVQTGIGLESAKRSLGLTLKNMSDQERPNLILNFGTGGAIHPSRRVGELIVGEKTISDESDGQSLDLDPDWTDRVKTYLEEISFHYISGLIYSTDNAVADTNLRREVYKQTGVEVVDMECYALADVAKTHGLPLISVKYITDNADSFVMKDFLAHVEEAASDLSEVMSGFIRYLMKSA